MKKKNLLLRLAVLVAAVMCTLGASAAEAYAWYNWRTTTLGFYYDNMRSLRMGTTYDLPTNNDYPGWVEDSTLIDAVTRVVFENSFANVRPTTTVAWFMGMVNLQSIEGMEYLNTSEVVSMMWMFDMCENLTRVNVSSFNTANVTNMRGMFLGCSNLRLLDLSSFNTANVTDMAYMFWDCKKLQVIYAGEDWDTDGVTTSENMFLNCYDLIGERGTEWFASNPKDKTFARIDGGPRTPGYFSDLDTPLAYACYTPTDSTLTFYFDNQRYYRSISQPCMTYHLNWGSSPYWEDDSINADVTRVVFDPSFADARPVSTYSWFYRMQNLRTIEGIENLNTSEVTNMAYMFMWCTSLTSLDMSRFNTDNVTNMEYMFTACNGLTSLDVSSFNTTNVTNMQYMFNTCSRLTSLDLSSFNTANVTNMTSMFWGSSRLQAIYVDQQWSTAAVTNSDNMFLYCYDLVGGQGTVYNQFCTDAGYARIDGGQVRPGYFTDINPIEAYACYTPENTTLTFYYDSQRSSRTGTTYDLNTSINFPDWQVDNTNSSVTQVVFDPLFSNARPTTTSAWFYGMTKLKSITDFHYLNTDSVTYMGGMFSRCFALENLDLSNFNTDNVTSLTQMFFYCASLTSLDLGSFNTAKVTNMNRMFYACQNLQTIYVDNGWSTDAVTTSTEMFNACTNLVGSQGTTYSESNPKDKTYAHIDGGPDNPGYLTEHRDAYACYTTENRTLTFYYDTQKDSRPDVIYDLNRGTSQTAWNLDYVSGYVEHVVFDPSFADARPTTTYAWFYFMSHLQDITGIEYLNTSEVTNMGWMFAWCNELTSVDLSNFDTSQVTDMESMFLNSENLRTIYVGDGWSTDALADSEDMFYGCTSLVGGMGTTYDADHVDGEYARIDEVPDNPGYFTDVNAPFEAYTCYTSADSTLTFYYDNRRYSRQGTTYDLNTEENDPVWNNDGTFASVTHAVFDPSFADYRPTTTYSWFSDMANLQTILGISNLNTSEVTTMMLMFSRCTHLKSLDLSHFNTSKVTNMFGMFEYCKVLTCLDLSSFNTSNVTNMNWMFYSCENLRTIYVGEGWSTEASTSTARTMFYFCDSLVGGQGTTYDQTHTDITYAHIDGGPDNPGYLTDANAPFEAYTCYTSADSTLTFYYDRLRYSRPGTTYSLNTGTDSPGWKTDDTNANVTKVVFDPSFAGARPTTTYMWFYLMSNLETITGIEYLNTSEVTNMGHMFNSCSKLTSIDMSGFSTSKVTDMRVMFYYCSGLTSLDLSSFNTANVTNMFNMFGFCSGLTSLDLSSFNTSNVTDMGRLFYGCSRLTTIYAGEDWSTEAVTNSSIMFNNNNNLVGGQGTTYNDSNPKDKAYAHIDGGPSNPGYFTDKNAPSFIRGDVNGDGNVNITDVTALINYLLSHNASGVNLDAANCNQDSAVNITDVTALINYLLSHNW